MKRNLIEYFFETVIKSPQKTALVDGDKQFTFLQLELESFKLAQTLIDSTKVCNKPIAVFLPKNYLSVISNIAITISGNIYMNLDVKTPIERIENVLSLIKPEILITNNAGISILDKVFPEDLIINLDRIDLNESIDFDSIKERFNKLIDTDPYCIINTSGSTGTPKGVVLNHKSFIDFIETSNEIFKFSESEIIGSLSPLVFDIYSFELCMMMAKGSTVVLIPDSFASFPIKILQLLNFHKVSFIFWVPTIMVNIANMDLLANTPLSFLKLVWFAGEVFPTKQFNYWKRYLPETQFANLYGPIEITLDCTYYIVDREFKDNEPLPIGRPYKNTDILILNDNNRPIEGDEEGELCVRGTSLAMGYYNNPEKTALAFVQNPLNKSYPEIIYRTGDIVCLNSFGEIMFKGRKDSLVKHLGYRIELGEIEHVVVNTLKIARNACVVYNQSKKQIILYYEASEEQKPGIFRQELSKKLPKYMIPSVFIYLAEMPRNTNGKIDRQLLKNMVSDE